MQHCVVQVQYYRIKLIINYDSKMSHPTPMGGTLSRHRNAIRKGPVCWRIVGELAYSGGTFGTILDAYVEGWGGSDTIYIINNVLFAAQLLRASLPIIRKGEIGAIRY
jgi:hypothetical protein